MRLSDVVACLCVCSIASNCWAKKNKSVSSASPSSFSVSATPADRIKTLKDFKVELLYTVPKDEQGSWVNLCADPRGRLIVSDEKGSLYRITLPSPRNKEKLKVDRIPIELGQAHGLLWVGDTLYVVVNGDQKTYKNGLYRVRDQNHDDQLDTVEFLHELDLSGEHGPHAVLLAPDGKSLFVLCGNKTPPVKTDRSRVPRVWDEDQLFPRIYGIGFMRGTPAPAGSIYKVDFDGKNWELVSMGFRNMFDAAFNADGELFTYDADMEWDVGAPWYRPTRVCHVVSGAEREVAAVLGRYRAAGCRGRSRFAYWRHIRLRREISREISEGFLHLRLVLRQAVCSAIGPARRELYRDARGVCHRHSIGSHGCHYQST
jgi:hypothetical protein